MQNKHKIQKNEKKQLALYWQNNYCPLNKSTLINNLPRSETSRNRATIHILCTDNVNRYQNLVKYTLQIIGYIKPT